MKNILDEQHHHDQVLHAFKRDFLDTKSASFCGAKWYNASMWFYTGLTASCHHNPGHEIDVESIKTNPKALHNTTQKKEERQHMKDGNRQINCQFCWVMEDSNPDAISDRVWASRGMNTTEDLQIAFESEYNTDFDLTYLEVGFDNACNMACAYCNPYVSTAWVKDIEKNGPYTSLPTDSRNLYVNTKFNPTDPTEYTGALINWWNDSLYKTLKILRITGGEPLLSNHTWRFLDWLADNTDKQPTDCVLHMTTNLSYDAKVIDRFLRLCDSIAMPIEVWSSTEAIGNKAEYARDGLNWDVWLDNFEKTVNNKNIVKCGICTTPAAHNIDGFADFLHWLFEYKKTCSTPIWASVNPLRFPSFQSVLVLPIEIRMKYRADILYVLNTVHEHNRTITYYERSNITRFADYLTTVDVPHKKDSNLYENSMYDAQSGEFDVIALQQDFKSFFTQYDNRRGKNFVETFPSLADWYNSI